MQHTHDSWDKNLEYIDYPNDLQVKDVNVYMHPSGMMMTHDYSCPIYREKHAVLSKGLMQPCWNCQKLGYKIIKKDLTKLWFQFWKNDYD